MGDWLGGVGKSSRCRMTARDLDGGDTSSSAVCDVDDVMAAERSFDAEDGVSA